MPINSIPVIVPATGQELSTGWSYPSHTAFDFESKTARIVYTFYASKAGAYGPLPPLKRVEILIGATPTPAVTTSTLVSPGSPAVYDGEGNQVSPAVAPVYETVETYPEIPSLPQLIAANPGPYAALAATLDALALTLPEFAGGQIEAVPEA